MTPVRKLTPRKNPDFLKENDRRRRARYGIKESFPFRTSDGVEHGEWSSGRTLNMSAQGILATFPEPVRAGTRVEMYMNWPGAYFDRLMVRLHLTATVIRTNKYGTALRIQTHRFEDINAQFKLILSPPARLQRHAQYAESQPA